MLLDYLHLSQLLDCSSQTPLWTEVDLLPEGRGRGDTESLG